MIEIYKTYYGKRLNISKGAQIIHNFLFQKNTKRNGGNVSKYTKKDVMCSGSVLVFKNLDDYSYSPKLDCGEAYKYKNLTDEITKEENIINCLRCGKCVSACPANLAPVLIKECSNKEELIKLQVNKCISCGLCSYICPSRIDLRNIVNEKKEVIK